MRKPHTNASFVAEQKNMADFEKHTTLHKKIFRYERVDVQVHHLSVSVCLGLSASTKIEMHRDADTPRHGPGHGHALFLSVSLSAPLSLN